MNYDVTRFAKVAAVFLFIGMFGTTILLVREYWYFHTLTEELVQVKQDYNNYIIAFKRLVRDEEQNAESQEIDTLGEKKKLSANSTQFLVVNRDREHTKKYALIFAQKCGLGAEVSKLYDISEPVSTSRKSRYQKVRRSVRRKRKFFDAHQQAHRWEHLKKEAIFIWPIDKKCFYLSSPFGPRKYKGVWGFHTGIDMAAVRGTPIAVAADGVVLQAGFSGGYGNTIVVMHNKKFKTRYAHLEKVLVSTGQHVCAGDIIGKVGDTGNVRKKGKDASHLHFEVYYHGKQVNPLHYLI